MTTASLTDTSAADPTAPPGWPVLLGALSLDLTRRGPVLTLSVRCDVCRCAHHHTWGFDPLLPGLQHPAGPTHRVAHCHRASSPYRARGYYVYPADTTDNRVILARFAELAACGGPKPAGQPRQAPRQAIPQAAIAAAAAD